ncbi:hypothetical protein ENBRE01_0761 [Enteropsectra breve]|nr:hypothetical protein ENBRE01_0761 [Enteropsectra breve]
MFNIVSIYHAGKHSFPLLDTLPVKQYQLKIHFLRTPKSILGIVPQIFSIYIENRVFFDTTEIPLHGDDREISYDAYKSELCVYMEKYLEDMSLFSRDPMDKIRFYFITKNLKKAREEIKESPDGPETSMLKFMCTHSYNVFNYYLINQEILINATDIDKLEGNSVISKFALENYKQIFYLENEYKNTAKNCYDEIYKIAVGLDDRTKIIFLVGFLHKIPVAKFASLSNGIKFKKPYLRIYLNMKLAEMALMMKKKHLALLLYIEAHNEKVAANDLIFKNELLVSAMSCTENATWKTEIFKEIEKTKDNAESLYGMLQQDDVFEIPNENINPDSIQLVSASNLYSFGVFKELQELCFTDSLLVKCSSDISVDGIFCEGGVFVPVFASGKSISVPFTGRETKVHIESLILSCGEMIELKKTFSRTERKGNVHIREIVYSEKICCIFSVTGMVDEILLDPSIGTYLFEEKTLKIVLNKALECFSFSFKIADEIYEEIVVEL